MNKIYLCFINKPLYHFPENETIDFLRDLDFSGTIVILLSPGIFNVEFFRLATISESRLFGVTFGG